MELKIGIFGVALVASLALSSCTGSERFDAPNNYIKTRNGAMIGGLVGAMGGLLTADGSVDRRKHALKEAIPGSGTGALIGNQLIKQAADLRRDIGNENISIQNTGDCLIVTLPQDILFAIDSMSLRSDLMADLRALSSNLQSYPDTSVQVVGHTDNTGAASYNQTLSMGRAESVSKVLLDNGVAPSRIIVMGRGEDQPIASNLTAQGRIQNRRVEIVILPNAVNG